MTSVNDHLYDFQVVQAIRWVRLGNQAAREIVAILNQVDARIVYLLTEDELTGFGRVRADALRRQLRAIMKQAHLEVEQHLTPLIQNAAVLSATLEVEAFKQLLTGLRMDIVTPNPGLIRTLAITRPFNGALLSEWVESWSEADINRTWRTIQDGLVAGDTTDDIVRAVRGTRAAAYGDGVRETTRRGAEALTRTAINHAASVGRESAWDENTSLIKKVRWVSTLDTRTTPICRERDGKEFPVGSGPRPPAHINCRSTTVAVTKSWRELGIDMDEIDEGTRASMDGQVPSDLTYYDWLKKTSRANAIEALGPTRYALWKEGGMPVESFVNDKGHLLTLDELRRKTPGPFKRV